MFSPSNTNSDMCHSLLEEFLDLTPSGRAKECMLRYGITDEYIQCHVLNGLLSGDINAEGYIKFFHTFHGNKVLHYDTDVLVEAFNDMCREALGDKFEHAEAFITKSNTSPLGGILFFVKLKTLGAK